MAYPALAIANAFIRAGLAQNRPVDPMKLQKLVYLAHGFNLAYLGQPLIHEQVEAWPYGPVVRSLYSTFKHYRSNPILKEERVWGSTVPLDQTTQQLVDQVWAKYGGRGAIDLSMMTHEPGYAWDIARKGGDLSWSSPEISHELIRDEFRRRAGLPN